MTRVSRAWAGRVVVALLVAAGVNLALVELDIQHDGALVSLLAVATVAAVALTLEALDATSTLPWTMPRRDARPDPGEDTRTATYRHVIEAHLTSREADDAISGRSPSSRPGDCARCTGSRTPRTPHAPPIQPLARTSPSGSPATAGTATGPDPDDD